MTDPRILFEDEDILLIEKPPGLVVNTADSIKGETVQDWMRERVLAQPASDDWYRLLPDDFSEEYGSLVDIFLERAGMVHRLDKDTSGVLLLAKNPGSLVNLLAQFQQRTTQKEYTCLTHGVFAGTSDVIRLPIIRSMKERSKFQVAATGRPAETAYTVQKTYALGAERLLSLLRVAGLEKGQTDAQVLKTYQSYLQFSLVRCQPKTGRTHQIRVHFAFLQHPLVGDHTYANKWRAKADQLWCPRQFLHASSLTFTHPRTKERMTVESPLSADLTAALAFLE
ncbi:RluA family pseudouridine synthase [Candidatus Woesebacteria bacterium]|nr:RluA family pseudouridine synthase [Candidatus Woesebacteria bacterium]